MDVRIHNASIPFQHNRTHTVHSAAATPEADRDATLPTRLPACPVQYLPVSADGNPTSRVLSHAPRYVKYSNSVLAAGGGSSPITRPRGEAGWAGRAGSRPSADRAAASRAAHRRRLGSTYSVLGRYAACKTMERYVRSVPVHTCLAHRCCIGVYTICCPRCDAWGSECVLCLGRV